MMALASIHPRLELGIQGSLFRHDQFTPHLTLVSVEGLGVFVVIFFLVVYPFRHGHQGGVSFKVLMFHFARSLEKDASTLSQT
jgi:hypothetical protein